MDPNCYPYVPRNILIRRYDAIELSNVESDEDYEIDEEAYHLLALLNGQTPLSEVKSKYSGGELEEVEGALDYFWDEGIIQCSESFQLKEQSNTDFLKLPKNNPFEPPYLKFLMINITERCNLRCKHCYITDKHQQDLPLDKLKELIQEFYAMQGSKLILTGGEPFLYEKFAELLEFLKGVPLKKVLLTNGTLITEKQDLLDLIEQNHCEVFVSIDGLEQSHNDFRNAECFQDSIEGIKLLLRQGIIVSINTMVHKKNLGEFKQLATYLRSLGDIKTWTVEVPTFDEDTPKEVIEEYEVTAKEGGEIMNNYWWGESYDSSGVVIGTDEDIDEISGHEQKSEMEQELQGYACGPFLMAVDVLGRVSKCGFFTEKSPGNIFEIGLQKSWEGIQQSSNWNISELKCAELNCEYLDECRGGCRYRALVYSGDERGIDPYKCAAYNKIHEKKE